MARQLAAERRCHECGRTAVTARQKYCSDECQKAVNARKAREWNYKKRAIHVDRPRTCKHCGTAFVPGYGTKRRAFCSHECCKRYGGRAGRAVRRARLRGVARENIRPEEIFKRDSWRCHICGEPVERREQVPHPLAPTLDHVIPIALGGDHLRTNVRCAHFICNSKKGAAGGSDLIAPTGTGIAPGQPASCATMPWEWRFQNPVPDGAPHTLARKQAEMRARWSL